MALGKQAAQQLLAQGNKGRVGLDGAHVFAIAVALAKAGAQPLHDTAGAGRHQYQLGGQEQRFFDVVGNQEDAAPGVLPYRQQQLLHLFAGKGVQRAEGLVHQQNLALAGNGAGNAHALAHAAGQLPGVLAANVGQAHQL